MPRTRRAAKPVNDYKHFYAWWLGLQVLLPLMFAILMWYPVAEKYRGIQFSFEKCFASGDLSLFSTLLFFGVLAEADGLEEKSLKMTIYKIISLVCGSVSLLLFVFSKDYMTRFDFPQPPSALVIPAEVIELSQVNLLVGFLSALLVGVFTLDIKRTQNSGT